MAKNIYNIAALTLLLLSTSNQSLQAISIGIEFGDGLSQGTRTALARAADRWATILVNDDLPKAQGNRGIDVIIKADGQYIDGQGGTLGMAGPTILRPGSFIPSRGVMSFDSDDLARMSADGSLASVIMHETGHVLGFGTIWDKLGLVEQYADGPAFVGEAAKEWYNYNGNPVPLANTGGPGTYGVHWRESVFGSELMTGYLGTGSNPLSRLTIAAFADMGYSVDYGQADEFIPTSAALSRFTLARNHTLCPSEWYYSVLVD